MKQKTLFINEPIDWKKHWVGMPEYKHNEPEAPKIVATFKFRSEEDYNLFHSVVKEKLYDGEKVFDGMQRKNEKQAWFPLQEKSSEYYYE